MKAIIATLLFLFASSRAFAQIEEGTTLVTCEARSAQANVGGFSLTILGRDDGTRVAELFTNTLAGPIKIAGFEIKDVKNVTRGHERIYEGPGFALNIQVGTSKAFLGATLARGQEVELIMTGCSY